MKLTSGSYAGLHIDECPSEHLLYLVDHHPEVYIRNLASNEYTKRTRTNTHREEVVIITNDNG